MKTQEDLSNSIFAAGDICRKKPRINVNRANYKNKEDFVLLHHFLKTTASTTAKALPSIQTPADTKIPFVGGVSLSKSYNIFINGQQALALLKKRQEKLQKEQKVAENEKNIAAACDDVDVLNRKIIISMENSNKLVDIQLISQQFKIVFKYLFKEFKLMSRKYDTVIHSVSTKGVNKSEIEAQLHAMDMRLFKKEETIITMMTLYRELLRCSDKVRRLENEMNLLRKCGDNGGNVRVSHSTNVRLKYLLHEMYKFQNLIKD